ncbi:hypothetical protein [Halodesulfovibrio aestuarii]|uniref:DUF2116 family Zn-ribbon domain-containing protein n=1 Tax=Halodesulfovibrio aestuarii TaxID=126333 RepID=A0ABV4JMV7_9BACT
MKEKRNASHKDTQKTKRCLSCGRKISTARNSNFCSLHCEAANVSFSKEEAF